MSKLILPISERSRKYGYIYWTATEDRDVEGFLKKKQTAHLTFQGTDHGEKNIDYKYRRISVGSKWTKKLPESSKNFVLSWKDNRTLDVVCR